MFIGYGWLHNLNPADSSPSTTPGSSREVTSSSDHVVNGHALNGAAAEEVTSSGHVVNGHALNGSAADLVALPSPSDHVVNGHHSNGAAAEAVTQPSLNGVVEVAKGRVDRKIVRYQNKFVSCLCDVFYPVVTKQA
jgi:hypothetical protein